MMKSIGWIYTAICLSITIASIASTSLATVDDRISGFSPSRLAQNRDSSAPPSKPLSLKSLAVGGISISSSEAQVRSILGKPQQIDSIYNDILSSKQRFLYYNKRGIHGITFNQNLKSGKFEFFSLLVNDVGSATSDGIKVGNTRQQLLNVYGTPSSIQQQGDDMEIVNYSSTANSADFSFTLFHDRITEIRLERRLS
jgi:hypothetical protein